MMKFELTEDQKLIKEMVNDFGEKELQDRAVEIDQNSEFPESELKKMAQLGLLGLAIPEDYGGSQVDLTSIILATEEISKFCASTGLTFMVHNLIVSQAIQSFGTETQRQKYLPQLASGKIFTGVCLVEPDSEALAGDMTLEYQSRDNGYILNGPKSMVLGTTNVELLMLFAWHEAQGVKIFLLDRKMPGLSITGEEVTMGIRGAKCCKLLLENCMVREANILGDPGMQSEYFKQITEYSKLGVSAIALGIAGIALKKSINYSQERKQFDCAIADFEGLQWMMADMEADLFSARKNLYYALTLIENNYSAVKECAIAKLTSSKAATRVTTDAIQIYGGYGYMKDFPLERYFRDAKATEFMLGNLPSQKTIIATKLLGK